MYITNKEIIECMFNDEKVHHIIISTNDFGTYANAIDSKGTLIKSLDNIGITIDNDDLVITEYDENNNATGACCIPLIWLLRNSTYPINTII